MPPVKTFVNPGTRLSGPPAQPNLPPVPMGEVVIQERRGDRSVRGELGESRPQLADGGGGWTAVEREGRVALVWWQGRAPAKVAFTVVFDGRFEDRNVERPCKALETMWGIGLDDDEPPPVVQFNSNGIVPLDPWDYRGRDLLWVIDALEPGDAEGDDLGRRISASYAVTLMRYVADETLSARSEAVYREQRRRAREDKAKDKKKKRRYRVKTGDTLVSIAASEYGDVDRWQDIAEANNLRDPRKHLRAGTVLVLP